MATEHGILDLSFPAAGDLSTKQFYPVTMNTVGRINTIATTLTRAFGVLQDDPDAAGRACAVRLLGESKVIVDGGTNPIYPGYAIGVNASGIGIATTIANQEILGIALEQSIAAGDIISVFVTSGQRY